MSEKVEKTDKEWREKLTAEQYHVTREKGTEPAFTRRLLEDEDARHLRVRVLRRASFQSDAKFDSGTGWPSFTEPVDDSKVALETDSSYGMTRTETNCRKCGAHLGHVFPDGPQPTGMRFCINSAALRLEEPKK